jgi:hypothetical protein
MKKKRTQRQRSRLYFKIKKAFRFISDERGRRYLAERGLFPIPFTAERLGGIFPAHYSGYFIDKKGNIVGTTIPPKPPEPYINLPITTSYEVKFKFTP